nr:hypothetical protein [Tanacetum cinerariifolium]
MAPAPNPKTADLESIDKYYESVNVEKEVACVMLSSMSAYLHRTLENLNAYDMLKELKTMFDEQAKQKLFETVKAFHACKYKDDQSVSSYLLKIKSYLDTLECLGFVMPNELVVSIILNSLNKDYDQVDTPVVLAIREGKIQKDKKKKLQEVKGKDKGKTKLDYAPKPKIHCHLREIIWRRTQSATTARSTSGIFTIEQYFVPNKFWVYDTGYGTHICNTTQGLGRRRKQKHGALNLYVGNGIRIAVEAIGRFDLILSNGLVIVLDNFHYAPFLARDVVYVSLLLTMVICIHF